MELIPILSTIILVATISTFILAVGAYILYKVQERRADRFARREVETESGELLEPSDFGGRELVFQKPAEKPAFVNISSTDRGFQEKERSQIKRRPTEPKFLKFTSEGYIKTSEDLNTGAVSWR